MQGNERAHGQDLGESTEKSTNHSYPTHKDILISFHFLLYSLPYLFISFHLLYYCTVLCSNMSSRFPCYPPLWRRYGWKLSTSFQHHAFHVLQHQQRVQLCFPEWLLLLVVYSWTHAHEHGSYPGRKHQTLHKQVSVKHIKPFIIIRSELNTSNPTSSGQSQTHQTLHHH